MSENANFITTTQGMSGFFAVEMWWNPEHGGFWEPWETGAGRYPMKDLAVREAKAWAEMEGLEYRE